MAKANAFILKLSPDRQIIFDEALDEYEFFAQAVDRFTHSRNAPLVCFIVDDNGMITHIARGKRGVNAGTNQSRLNLKDITQLTSTVFVGDIIEGVPNRNRKPVSDRFTNGGLLTPRAFEEVIDLIPRLAPETQSLIERFSKNTRQRLANLSSNTRQSLANQKETVATAMQMAGFDRSPLAEWKLETEGAPRSFLDGLPQMRHREDPMIMHDMIHMPGYDFLKDAAITSTAIFQEGDNRLTVIMANRQALEEQTGCDLIYYNETFNAFIMVQYKAMDPDKIEGSIFRFPEKQLTDEISRMDAFLIELSKTTPSAATGDFRLNTNPFYLKFCPRIQFEPDTTGLMKGMYIPLDYWRRLEKDTHLKGPKGGMRLAYSNVGRYFDNTAFTTMVKGAWVGTTIPQSKLLEKWMREVMSSGRSITYAVKSDKPDPDDMLEYVDLKPDLGLDGVGQNPEETEMQTISIKNS